MKSKHSRSWTIRLETQDNGRWSSIASKRTQSLADILEDMSKVFDRKVVRIVGKNF